jgi:predicted nucleic acid-binding protein
MILVDSSVWVDYFRGTATSTAAMLDSLLGVQPVIVGDLILTEVLQGFTADRDYRIARRLFDSNVVETIALGGREVAIRAAQHHRHLRARGVTVRKTIDAIIATRCIVDGITLLHNDRDFEPYETYLGLRALH